MKDYFTVSGNIQTETAINRSRFICNTACIGGEDEAAAYLAEVSAKYKDATHNCYAYVINPEGSVQRFSDDGEPQGTAGQPMLEVLKKNNLTYVISVVTRYFGGIKLGAGGLVGAYTKAVTTALGGLTVVRAVYSAVYKARFDYSEAARFVSKLPRRSKVLRTEYADGVTLTFAVEENEADATVSLYGEVTAGADKIDLINKEYVTYENEV